MSDLSRRDFARGLGGLVVAFHWGLGKAGAAEAPAAPAGGGKPLPFSMRTNKRLDAWLAIAADGSATVFTGKAELGQGALTAIKQIAADELDLPWDRVRIVSADTARTPDEAYTAGSQTIENSGVAVRYAAAEARHLLIERAAARWGVPAAGLFTFDGHVTDGSRVIEYGQLVTGDLLQREATAAIPPRPAGQRKICGTSVPRIDIPSKVTGVPIYVQDMRLPGMLHGRVVRPPSYNATLAGLDEAAVKTLPGVVAVVRDGNFLGVVARREEQAIAAREALMRAAQWRDGAPLPLPGEIVRHMTTSPAEDHVVNQKNGGSPAAQPFTATYTRPYIAHASIGPSCALARLEDGKLTVWTHSQGVFPLRRDLAKVLALPEAAITVVHTQGSGCYGHNGADDVALDAALLSRGAGGRPVRVQWMRDDEFKWEPYGSAQVVRLAAGLGADGTVADWHFEVWSNTHSRRPGAPGGSHLLAGWHLARPVAPPPPKDVPQPAGGGDRNSIPLYQFPRQTVLYHMVKEMPIRISALRTLGHHCNIFAIESAMDELAAQAAVDPLTFRLTHLKDERARAVLTTAIARAGWKPGDKGRGIGFSQYKNHATYLAVVADIELDRASGAIRVTRITAAADCGEAINPNGVLNQLEGGIIQATSWTLKEQVSFDRAGITTRNWDDYPVITFNEVPAVDITLLQHPDKPPLGTGEAAMGPTTAAIANAFASLTGRRIRDLPLSPQKVLAALA